jgi:hypothetical protein
MMKSNKPMQKTPDRFSRGLCAPRTMQGAGSSWQKIQHKINEQSSVILLRIRATRWRQRSLKQVKVATRTALLVPIHGMCCSKSRRKAAIWRPEIYMNIQRSAFCIVTAAIALNFELFQLFPCPFRILFFFWSAAAVGTRVAHPGLLISNRQRRMKIRLWLICVSTMRYNRAITNN